MIATFSPRAALRIVEREAVIYRRLWYGNFFSSFLAPFLYLGAMGLGLGGMVDAAGRSPDGVPYLQFVAPGLLAATAMQNAAGESLWPVLGGIKWTRHFHAMVATPLTAAEVFVGNLVWLGVRLAMNVTVFLLAALALGAVASPFALLALPSAVLAALALAAPLMAFAATQEEDANFSLLMRVLILPLFLFSGTFYSVALLPDAVRPLVWLSPLWHGVELCRAATTGRLAELGLPGAVAHLAILAAFVAAGVGAGTRLLTTRLAS